jgi:dihydroorotate dehydrogenase electron transfer subunit
LTGDYWLLELEAPEMARALVPGQFVNVRVDASWIPFVRRPFSVYRVDCDKGSLQIAYKVLGTGTEMMTRMAEGSRCDIIGPLGNAFLLPERAKRIALVGRGIGIAALPMLADRAAESGIEVRGYLSARTLDNLVAIDIFHEHGFHVTTHVDDDGLATRVTDHLERDVENMNFDAMYVCGSNRLVVAVDKLARKINVPSEAAMEQHMACGFGDCHGCVIEVKAERDGLDRVWREVCHHGPVFQTWEVANAHV